MPERLAWLLGLEIFPAVVLAAYGLGLRGRPLGRLAVVCAGLLTAVSAVGLDRESFARLSIVLIPFAAFLWFLGTAVTPTASLEDAGLARAAAACGLELAAFSTTSPVALILVWAATSALLAAGHPGERFRGARRLVASYLGLSTILLAAGIAMAAWAGPGAPRQAGLALVFAAVLVRRGIFPFHAWIPELFERGRIGAAARFNAPQLGAYVALVLAVPRADSWLLRGVAGLALVTAGYGALLALYQSDARRACGYLFVSQSSLVIAGLEIPNRGALAGALILWVSSGIAVAGLSRAVLALEARRGRLSLDVKHGGYERMPLLAVSFLVMSLAIANFPGTLGFIGGEMLARGAVDSFPALGFFAVAATALAGLAAIRMYFSLFCGKRDSGAHLRLLPAERLGFAAAAVLLIGLGLAPRRLAGVLNRASSRLLAVQRTVAVR